MVLKCIEYVWDVCVFKTLWYAYQELSTLGWGQRAFAGRRHWKLSCDLLPKAWWSKHETIIFCTEEFSNRKFIALNHLEVSPNKRDLESNLLIPQESVSYVMFFLHKSRCLISESPVSKFAKSLSDLVEEFSSKIDGDFDLTTMPNGLKAWDMRG